MFAVVLRTGVFITPLTGSSVWPGMRQGKGRPHPETRSPLAGRGFWTIKIIRKAKDKTSD
ncbi:hypothetical protein BEI59_00005 [Eisenbergiella tayi]|uniref:Uncharacterized protein n=1 Tax=Eisenbergiella tayi TaxID=1432052 RepID=A0A1E3UNU9_9FIRM|nr:hypothetical protein BEI59_00005 [Eisenbergiella tayi]